MGYEAREVGRVYQVRKTTPWGAIIFWGIVALIIIGAMSGNN